MDRQRFVSYLLLGCFGIFVGAQITEGCLMVPQWKSMSPAEFYSFYGSFGPTIGKFFTILTVVAGLIAIGAAIYQIKMKSRGRFWALEAAVLMIICIAMFYVYFKGANELFYAGKMDAAALRAELNTWKTWHNIRVVLEVIALISLCYSFSSMSRTEVERS